MKITWTERLSKWFRRNKEKSNNKGKAKKFKANKKKVVESTDFRMDELSEQPEEIMYDEVKSQKIQYVSEQELKELFYKAILADEINIDFNDKRYRNFRKPLADIERQKGPIDFSKLANVKDVIQDDKVKCPTCKGQGKISKERLLQILGR